MAVVVSTATQALVPRGGCTIRRSAAVLVALIALALGLQPIHYPCKPSLLHAPAQQLAVRLGHSQPSPPHLTSHVHGFVAPGFEGVRDAFVANFEDGLEAGAALAVQVNDTVVVDLWAGVTDGRFGAAPLCASTAATSGPSQPWSRDSLAYLFSATKGMTAVAAAVLVDQGHLAYSDRIAQYWPEFGTNGKENITVAHVLSHQSGVSTVEAPTRWSVHEWSETAHREIVHQTPLWSPTSGQFGYHAWTGATILGELVRRVDPSHRSLSQFFDEEVAAPLGADVHVGALPRQQHDRVARIGYASVMRFLEDAMHIKNLWPQFMEPRSMVYRSFNNPRGNPKHFGEDTSLWQLDRLENTNGFATARGLAKVYATLAGGGVYSVEGADGQLEQRRLLSEATIAEATKTAVAGTDLVMLTQGAFGMGFAKCSGHFPAAPWPQGANDTTGQARIEGCFGHPGFGGMLAFGDQQNAMGVAYTPNLLSPRPSAAGFRWTRIKQALYEAL